MSSKSESVQQSPQVKQNTPAPAAPLGIQLSPALALQRSLAGMPQAHDILLLQRTIGNQAVQGLLQRKEAPAPANEPPNSYHRIASDITGIFEGGKAGTLQTYDSGIISYGKHQATLAGGALQKVLERYLELSESSTAQKIAGYMERVRKREESLRNDQPFLDLLKAAAKESAMDQAQEDVFSANYWAPAVKSAESLSVSSALGHAIIYDTMIQGGHAAVAESTAQRLKGKEYSEQEYLQIYLEERKARLLRIAESKRKKGDEATAKALESSADYRISALKALVDAGNLDLTGEVKVRGKALTPLKEGATKDHLGKATQPGPEKKKSPPPPTAAIGQAKVTASALNVRAGANASASKLGSLPQGSQVEVFGRQGDWLAINYQGKPGYISGLYATFTPTPTKPQAPAPTSSASSSTSSGGILDTLEEGLDYVGDTASELWDSASSWVSSWFSEETQKAAPPTQAPQPRPAPSPLQGLMAKARLSPEEIGQARELISQEPDEKRRGDLFEALQSKVYYHNQRDNASKEGNESIGDKMCNLTSLAMCLSYLGVPNPDPTLQYEDALEKIRLKKKLPARTLMTGWSGVAKELGVTVDVLGSEVVEDKAWYTKNVLSRLRAGQSVMLSMTGHIVRVQGLTEQGLVVDDPYGRSILLPGTDRSWEKGGNNSRENPQNDGKGGNRGEDHVWPWAAVAKHSMLWIAAFKK